MLSHPNQRTGPCSHWPVILIRTSGCAILSLAQELPRVGCGQRFGTPWAIHNYCCFFISDLKTSNVVIMTKLFHCAVLSAALIAANALSAADADPAPNISPLSLSVGVDFVTSYVFRGYIVSDTGFIAQPWGQLNYAAFKSDSLTITPYVGSWNDVQQNSPSGSSSWYESDVYGGVDVGLGDFTLGAIYTFYTYPDQGADEIQELGVKFSYNDAGLMEKAGIPIVFKPYAAWYFETSDPAGRHQYVELGLNPSYTMKTVPVTFSLPLAIGLSPSGYYRNSDGHNAPVGYVSAGAFVSYALPISAKWGSWSIYGGATWYDMAAYSTRTYNDEDASHWLVGKVGVSMSY